MLAVQNESARNPSNKQSTDTLRQL